MLLNDGKDEKTLNLGITKETYFNKEYDIAIIEIKEIDNINNYLELHENLFKNEIEAYYKNISIYTLHYFNGDKASASYGLSTEIDNYEIKHLCSTEYGSSGSPILNLSNNKVIGIHKQGSKFINFGTLLAFPLNYFLFKKNPNTDNINVKKSIKEKLVKLELLHDIKKQMNRGPKMKIHFNDDYNISNGTIIQFNLETTIDEALKYYSRIKNKVDFIYSGTICFSLHNRILKFGDRTQLIKFANGVQYPIVNVLDRFFKDIRGNKINIDDYRDEDSINKEIKQLIIEIKDFLPNFEPRPDNTEFYKFLDEQKITVELRLKKNFEHYERKYKELSNCKLTLSNQETVGNLIDMYNAKTGTNDVTFEYNFTPLNPYYSITLFDFGIKDNSVIIISDMILQYESSKV